MTEGFAWHDGVRIAYDVEGPPGGAPMLLIMGLGLQMLFWPDSLRALLTEAGFRVARFDNRDVGLSTHLGELGAPSLLSLARRRPPGYGLADMAGDALAVLDALSWRSAHVVGVSLGGMIAQTMAGLRPGRVRSLTSVSATPSPRIGRPGPRAVAALLRRPAATREAAARQIVDIFRVIGSPGYPHDEDWLREVARRCHDRAHDPAGVRRQLAAIGSAGDRRPMLRTLRLPGLVIHGDADPLVRLPGGLATARAVPGAKLVVYSGMGHDLPAALQPDIVAEITAVAGRGADEAECPPGIRA
jgi:pimeloyl-ACP methyl ester carboxylesterase